MTGQRFRILLTAISRASKSSKGSAGATTVRAGFGSEVLPFVIIAGLIIYPGSGQ